MASGVELATAWVRLVPSAEGIKGSVTDALAPGEAEAEESGKRAGGRFSAGAKVAIAAGAAAAVAGLVKVFQTGMEELKFGEQISAQTDQLIENTGAGFSTKFVEDYTLALSKVSGISEEDLQSAGNAVLKFGDLNEETYKRSVDAINNMGAAGKDVAGVGEALGKALADPAAAAGLLKRQGVILNEEQKTLIDNLIATGDKAGAQAVILDSLEGTYGGMAEAAGATATGGLNKLNNMFENLSATAVESLMPALTFVVDGLTGFFGWLEQNQAIIPVIAAVIGVILVAAFIAWAASIWAVTIALLANPITWIIIAIIALIAAIVFLVLNWDQVVAFIMDIWGAFIGWITAVIEGFVGWWNDIWTAVWEWIVSVWQGIVSAVTGYFNNLFLGFQIIGAAISGWWNDLWNGIVQFFVGVIFNIIAVVNNIRDAFQNVFGAIGSIVRGAFEGVVGFVRGYVNNIIRLVNGVINGINGVAGAVGAAIGVNIQIPNIPMLATGGTITRGGSVIVGENGPELLRLPRGASVDPDIAGGSGAIYVQNPFTGEYLLARAADVADARISTAGSASARTDDSGRRVRFA